MIDVYLKCSTKKVIQKVTVDVASESAAVKNVIDAYSIEKGSPCPICHSPIKSRAKIQEGDIVTLVILH